MPGRVMVMNDLSNIYLAISFDTAEEGNGAFFEFHEGFPGEFEPGNDILLINPAPDVGFTDSHRSPELYGIFDTDDGGTIDGKDKL